MDIFERYLAKINNLKDDELYNDVCQKSELPPNQLRKIATEIANQIQKVDSARLWNPPKHIKRICGYTTLISPINIQSVAIPDYDKTGTFYRLTATECAR